jgi:hypothetical protein
MDVDIPDLTQQLKITDYSLIFSGTYSTVYKGILHDEIAVNHSICISGCSTYAYGPGSRKDHKTAFSFIANNEKGQ